MPLRLPFFRPSRLFGRPCLAVALHPLLPLFSAAFPLLFHILTFNVVIDCIIDLQVTVFAVFEQDPMGSLNDRIIFADLDQVLDKIGFEGPFYDLAWKAFRPV